MNQKLKVESKSLMTSTKLMKLILISFTHLNEINGRVMLVFSSCLNFIFIEDFNGDQFEVDESRVNGEVNNVSQFKVSESKIIGRVDDAS